MIDAFLAGEDIHAATAILFDFMGVLPEQRYQAKAVNFGILYGMSASSLSKSIQCLEKRLKVLLMGILNAFLK